MLELGCAGGAFGAALKLRFPGAVDVTPQELTELCAAQFLIRARAA